MLRLLAAGDRIGERLTRAAPAVLPLVARFAFAAVLFRYFWNSAMTKIGPGPLGVLHPTDGAFAQIYPRAFEAAGYDAGKLGAIPHLVVLAGTIAELVLPVLIVLGLMTRLAALGMAVFVVVQSLTDRFGLGVAGDDWGRWFDASSTALILDQRTLWMLIFAILGFLGAGPLSLDRAFHRLRRRPASGANSS